jgi:hypothetical protein
MGSGGAQSRRRSQHQAAHGYAFRDNRGEKPKMLRKNKHIEFTDIAPGRDLRKVNKIATLSGQEN